MTEQTLITVPETVLDTPQKLDYESFVPKLGSWAPHFKKFIEEEEMWKIMEKIREDAWYPDGRRKETIVPLPKDTFRAFSTTNKADLRVIFYLQDPYPKAYKGGVPHATGIAMDCRNSPNGKLQPSLDLFYDAIENQYDKKVERCKSLEYLHEQGVMMLNTDLTCKLNKTSSHEGLWLPFQKYFLEEVMGTETHVIYVLAGKVSQKMKRYITPFARILEVEHPAAAAHRNGDWNYDGIFKKINNILKDNNLSPILWDKKEWDEYKEPPF